MSCPELERRRGSFMNHQVSDCLIRIKNAALAHRRQTMIPYANLNKAICKTLAKEGFLEDVRESSASGKKVLTVFLKYDRRVPVLTDVRIISKPSLRVYTEAKNIPLLQRGMYTVVVSTNQGIMSGRQAYKKDLGGEVLFKVW